jgi:hypothetical protein
LYRALGRAYDFALASARDAEGYAGLLKATGLKVQARAPFTPVAKLVFGPDHDKTRLTEYAAVLAHAAHLSLGDGSVAEWLASVDGGIKAVVAAERERRRPAPRPRAAGVGDRAAVATLALPVPGVAAGEAVLLVARARGDGTLDVLGAVPDVRLAERLSARLD